MESEYDLGRNKEGAKLKEGVVYKRFIHDDGTIEDVEDDMFEETIMAAALALYPVNVPDFLAELDMIRQSVPNLRVFSHYGVTYKLTDIPFNGWATGCMAFAEAITGRSIGAQITVDVRGSAVRDLK